MNEFAAPFRGSRSSIEDADIMAADGERLEDDEELKLHVLGYNSFYQLSFGRLVQSCYSLILQHESSQK